MLRRLFSTKDDEEILDDMADASPVTARQISRRHFFTDSEYLTMIRDYDPNFSLAEVLSRVGEVSRKRTKLQTTWQYHLYRGLKNILGTINLSLHGEKDNPDTHRLCFKAVGRFKQEKVHSLLASLDIAYSLEDNEFCMHIANPTNLLEKLREIHILETQSIPCI